MQHHGMQQPPPRPSGSNVAQAEPPRPVEPTNIQSAPPPPQLSTASFDSDRGTPRQTLPGLAELLSPTTRTEARSPFGRGWTAAPAPPPAWPDCRPRVASSFPAPPQTVRLPQPSPIRHAYVPPPFPERQSDVHPSDSFHVQTTNPHPGSVLSAPAPAPVNQRLDVPPPLNNRFVATHRAGPLTTTSCQIGPPMVNGHGMERRQSVSQSRTAATTASHSLQCVGQREIPGEGLVYIYQDGSTCPTIIDGEPVNPLWGTTKAGKARKRLAQACL